MTRRRSYIAQCIALVGTIIGGISLPPTMDTGGRIGWEEPEAPPKDRHGFTWPPLTPEQHESNRQLALKRDTKRVNRKTAKRRAKADGCKCWKHERRRLKEVLLRLETDPTVFGGAK